ncbi:hypothetical protein NY057_14905 [Curtobacterium flaccumfaciens]|uniref:hypothetical protein n=1 Tax=Curtobacterium flaccumfaciens TaxID=2035 RepID=UPI00220225B2|nr:hypothetical protein [Curtobacterium flaccumfaciens]UWD82083.1 hypothetical protein NY057_14905 [Curtobacterium flaccumfaciens]
MNTEPPQGDDLQRMLVSMKQNVLERATPRPKRRGRRAGIAIGVVGVLLLGAAGGGVALGLIPTSITTAPAPTATTTPEPSPTETSSGAPVVGGPTPTANPTPTPTPTSTRPPYSLSDPDTWTISGREIGPIAFGSPVSGELDEVADVYTGRVEGVCPNPNVSNFYRDGSAALTVVAVDGLVWGVDISSYLDPDVVAPTTAEGLGIGSTLDELRAAYPDLTSVDSVYFSEEEGSGLWSIERDGRYITFELGGQASTVVGVWVSSQAEVPYEFCG